MHPMVRCYYTENNQLVLAHPLGVPIVRMVVDATLNVCRQAHGPSRKIGDTSYLALPSAIGWRREFGSPVFIWVHLYSHASPHESVSTPAGVR